MTIQQLLKDQAVLIRHPEWTDGERILLPGLNTYGERYKYGVRYILNDGTKVTRRY